MLSLRAGDGLPAQGASTDARRRAKKLRAELPKLGNQVVSDGRVLLLGGPSRTAGCVEVPRRR